MTSIARDALAPIRRRVATVDKRAARAARDADRALSRVEATADDLLDDGRSIAQSIHARIEDKPHLAILAALAAGALFGLLSRGRH